MARSGAGVGIKLPVHGDKGAIGLLRAQHDERIRRATFASFPQSNPGLEIDSETTPAIESIMEDGGRDVTRAPHKESVCSSNVSGTGHIGTGPAKFRLLCSGDCEWSAFG